MLKSSFQKAPLIRRKVLICASFTRPTVVQMVTTTGPMAVPCSTSVPSTTRQAASARSTKWIWAPICRLLCKIARTLGASLFASPQRASSIGSSRTGIGKVSGKHTEGINIATKSQFWISIDRYKMNSFFYVNLLFSSFYSFMSIRGIWWHFRGS